MLNSLYKINNNSQSADKIIKHKSEIRVQIRIIKHKTEN
jgi:hypothetical protein